jgi:hypothetical protein
MITREIQGKQDSIGVPSPAEDIKASCFTPRLRKFNVQSLTLTPRKIKRKILLLFCLVQKLEDETI